MARTDSAGRFCSVECSKYHLSGAAHPLYNGGLSYDIQSGRWKVMCRDGTQMWFYRAVMAAELGRLLTEDEIVHHLNDDPSDDRPENLVVTTRSEHMDIHRHDLLAGRR